MKAIVIAGWIFIGSAAFSSAASACPGCKEAVFDTPVEAEQKQDTARGYAVSIGLMLSVPAVLIGAVSFRSVRSARRQARSRGDATRHLSV